MAAWRACRQSGASDAPMVSRDAVPFQAPPNLAVEVDLPNRGRVKGLGIRKGVTLIGKSLPPSEAGCLASSWVLIGSRMEAHGLWRPEAPCLQSMKTYQTHFRQHVSEGLLAAAVGGGFNGKSTLLQAIEAGVYNKVRQQLHYWALFNRCCDARVYVSERLALPVSNPAICKTTHSSVQCAQALLHPEASS